MLSPRKAHVIPLLRKSFSRPYSKEAYGGSKLEYLASRITLILWFKLTVKRSVK